MAQLESWLRDRPIAHRGLHDQSNGVVENSISAFEAAIKAGYAIELDVQKSGDGEALVFHDHSLDRLTDTTGLLRCLPTKEIKNFKLTGSNDTIPTLCEVLELVNGRVPVLVEIKNISRSIGELEQRTADVLSAYGGPFAVQSFNPLVLKWFRENHPSMLRGQLATDVSRYGRTQIGGLSRFATRNLLTILLSRPHFIGYDVDALPAIAPRLTRSLGLPLLAWTVRTLTQRATSARYADNIIFEGFEAPIA